VSLINTRGLALPLHIGIGGRILDHGSDDYFEGHTHFGVRLPIGLTFYLKAIPIDIFFEIAYIFDVIADDHGYSDFNSNLGIRYYF
jgi:hypothetical protein